MNSNSSGLPPLIRNKLRGDFALGAIIFFPYVVAIAWQYCGVIHNRPIAWSLTVMASAMVWTAYVAWSEPSNGKSSWQFWIIVALPLLAIYLLRFDLPDVSFDVLNYHIFESERILRGSLYLPEDFFPGSLPVNPTPDVLTGLYRHLLGYRLGTVVNYVALIWTGLILNRWLGDYIRSVWLRNLGVFFILCTEQLLFQINNYMVDLLALPMLLEATMVAIDKQAGRIWQRTSLLMLLLGMAIAFKLSNLFLAAPIVLIFIVNVVTSAEKPARLQRLWQLVKMTPVATIIFLAPVAPFSLLMYRLTGNPIFPLYNGIFKSPFWPQGAAFDPRWGPHGFAQTLVWPIALFIHPERLSEFPYYSGRVTLGFILCFVCLVIARRERSIYSLAAIALISTILWSASSGYIRYALYLELASGILLVWLASFAWKKLARLPPWGRVAVQLPLWLLLLGQGYYALRYVKHWEWSQRQPMVSRDDYSRREYASVVRDRSFRSFIADQDLGLFDNVDVWIETTYKTSALEVLLKPEAPVIAVRMDNFFETSVARQRFADLMNSVQGKRMFTLTTRESLNDARQALAARGLSMGTMRVTSLNYFSDALRFEVFLAEVRPLGQESGGATAAAKGVRLPDMAFSARLAAANAPTVMRAGQPYAIRVALTNESKIPWPGRQETWNFQITIGNRWLTQGGQMLTNIDGRAALFEDLPAGQTVELPLTVKAPAAPGEYVLELDVIQEGVAWFGDRGSAVLRLPVKVE